MSTRVAIIVTEDGSIDLAALVRIQNVWVADTPLNRATAESISAVPSASDPYTITTFNVDPRDAPDAWVAEILAVVDEHHGLRAEWSSDVVLDVHGAGATPRVRAALEQLGLFVITERPGGFTAERNGSV